jgi:tetratricopeptide (TPR) repeat protein
MGVGLYQTLYAEATFCWEDGIRTSAQLLAYAEEYAMAGLYLYLGTLMAGRHHFHLGELRRARHLLSNAINLSAIFGIRTGISWAHAFLGDVHFIEGRLEEALKWYATGHELARTGRGDGWGLPLSLIGMAHASACLGIEPARVTELAEESFRAFEASSNYAGLATALVRYLEALRECGDDGTLAIPVTARLDDVLARIGAPSCEFWPGQPPTATSEERALPIADYWRRRATSEIATTPDAGADGKTGALLVNLSTVDGFVPAFARHLR